MTDSKSDYMFLDPDTLEVAGLRLRPFSIGTFNLIQRLGVKLDGQQDEAKQMRDLAAVAWMQSAPIPEVLKAVHSGKADEAIDAFMFQIDLTRVGELSDELNRIGEQVAAASFGIEAKPGDKEESTPPN
jgi:hypothetical protein